MFDQGVITRTSPSTLSIRLVWPFVEIARQHECNALLARFQSRLGLRRTELEHPDTRVALRVVGPLLSELTQAVGSSNIGLTAAQKVRPEHLGLAEYLARSRDTLGAAITSSLHFARLLCDGVHHGVEIKNSLVFVSFWFDSNLTMPDSAYEFTLATQLNAIRRITRSPEFAPVEAHFMHPRPKDATAHELLFNCKLRFNMPFTQLVLPASCMTLPLPGAEPALNRLLEQQAGLALGNLPHSKGFVPQVLNLLSAELNQGSTSATRIAQRLGISSRTLSRRLRKENTNYQLLFDQTRRDLALRDLTHTPRPIRDIAKRLGFSSSQSFHRAFRRWTGYTATSYRKSSKLQFTV